MAVRVRCALRICTCGEFIGRRQAEFELRINSGVPPIDVIEEMELTKICCRANLLFPPALTVTDANSGRVIDTRSVITRGHSRPGEPTIIDGPILILAGVPPFPEF